MAGSSKEGRKKKATGKIFLGCQPEGGPLTGMEAGEVTTNKPKNKGGKQKNQFRQNVCRIPVKKIALTPTGKKE